LLDSQIKIERIVALRGEKAEFRQSILQSGMHRRTPDAVASLALGWEHFLLFAVESGAITVTEQMAQWGRVWAALCDVATEQANHQQTEDPAVRFLSLLASAVASGRGHLASEMDGTPMQPRLFGWREAGLDDQGNQLWRAQGQRIGWIKVPEICANLCFGGTRRNRLFMCASQSLYSVYVETQGAHFC